MRAQLSTFATVLIAGIAAQLVATYLVNNVRSVRNVTGPL